MPDQEQHSKADKIKLREYHLRELVATHENSIFDVLSLEAEAELKGSQDVLGPLEGNERLLREVGLRNGDLLFAVLA